jgi:hypothetical protein
MSYGKIPYMEKKFYSCAFKGDVDEVRRILGTDLEVGNEGSWLKEQQHMKPIDGALVLACSKGHTATAELLLSHGADPNIHERVSIP